MSKYGADAGLEHIARLREILVVKPRITNTEAIEAMAQVFDYRFSERYIRGMLRKIYRERAERINHQLLNRVLAEYQDVLDTIQRQAWQIFQDPKNADKPSVKLRALNLIRETRTEILEKLFDAGVFERKLGSMTTIDGFSAEDALLIEKAFGFALEPEDDEKPREIGDGKQSGALGTGTP